VKPNPECPTPLNSHVHGLKKTTLDFSFSGLKTAVLNHCNRENQKGNPLQVADICASFQEAVAEILVGKTVRAASQTKYPDQ